MAAHERAWLAKRFRSYSGNFARAPPRARRGVPTGDDPGLFLIGAGPASGRIETKRTIQHTKIALSRPLPASSASGSQKSKINFRPAKSITYKHRSFADHLVSQTHLLPCNREPERTHDVSGRCPLSSRDHGGISLKQWAAGAPVIGAAPVSSGKPKRPRSEGLSGSGALQLFLNEKEKRIGRKAVSANDGSEKHIEIQTK